MDGFGLQAADIYSAIACDEMCAQLPMRLARSFGARSAVIHWQYADGFEDVRAHPENCPDERLLERVRGQPTGHSRSKGLPRAKQHIGQVAPGCLEVRVQESWGHGAIAIERGSDQGDFCKDARQALSEASIHLRTMLALKGELTASARKSRSLQAMLDEIAQAAFLINEDGILLLGNRAGAALLRRGDAVSQANGRVEAVFPNSGQRLRQAVKAACSSSPTCGSVLLERRDGRPFLATISPVRLDQASATALVSVNAPSSSHASICQQLQSLFGLTNAEASIAGHIASGMSLTEIAAHRVVSVETIRVQLKSVLQKTGARRQSEVVSIVKDVIPVAGLLD